ncbi:MAG: pirin [Verrucomicrobia bacterium]|nr:pirin [Armatimonadota bacterium]MBU1908680.1 pirin [Verrucomicrobiota bacterium]
MKPRDIQRTHRLVDRALEIEWENAEHAGAMAYFARILVMATMPHSRPKTSQFQRTNGKFTMTMMAPDAVGLPFGSIPRLVLAWLSTEAVRTRSRQVELGRSLSEFMRQLDLAPTGGQRGDITRLRNQMKRLFATAISCSYADDDGGYDARRNFPIADQIKLWWDPRRPNDRTLWESTITLGERFYQEIIEHPVPLDMRALKALKQSPLALDIYAWLTYRMYSLDQPVVIPWAALEAQFGASYGHTRKFRYEFLRRLQDVLVVYRRPRVKEVPGQGLQLSPSLTSVPSPPRRLLP